MALNTITLTLYYHWEGFWEQNGGYTCLSSIKPQCLLSYLEWNILMKCRFYLVQIKYHWCIRFKLQTFRSQFAQILGPKFNGFWEIVVQSLKSTVMGKIYENKWLTVYWDLQKEYTTVCYDIQLSYVSYAVLCNYLFMICLAIQWKCIF